MIPSPLASRPSPLPFALLALLLLLLAACGAPATPVVSPAIATPDLATTRTTDQGRFVAAYTSDLQPPAINKVHGWTLDITTPDGSPVNGAEIAVEGGMPVHNHGLPTTPQVSAAGDGRYRVEGIKYQMPGEWDVTVRVDAGGVHDEVTFHLLLP